MAVYKRISDVKDLYLKANRTELLKTYPKEQLRAAEAVLNHFCSVVEANNLYLEKVEIEPNPDEDTKTVVPETKESVPVARPKKEKVAQEIIEETASDEDDDEDTEDVVEDEEPEDDEETEELFGDAE